MLHVRFVKKAVNKAFYSPSSKFNFSRLFWEATRPQKTICSAKPDINPVLFAINFIFIKN